MKCRVCDAKCPVDCQLCKACLEKVKVISKLTFDRPATFQEAVERLREEHLASL